MCNWRVPSRRALHGELIEHSHSAMGYTMALAWTHLFLPMLGEADLFQRSAAELMEMKTDWHRCGFVWLYTICVTALCWWLYCIAEERQASLKNVLILSDHVWVATWGTLATSLVYVMVWAWICAMLSVLPTGTPLRAFGSGACVTVVAAASVVAGQHGYGPFLLLRGSKPDRLKAVVFFTTIMTAMMWVGALEYATSTTIASAPRWACSWCIAFVLCVGRWVLLWHSDHSQSTLLRAAGSYPSSPDLALDVGLLANLAKPPRGSSPLPSVSELQTASVGLVALVVAWSGSVALQTASTATWKAWPWPYTGNEAVAPTTGYALVITAAGVYAVATARAIAEVDGMAMERAGSLAAETAALGVASGWSWYHALECILPSLCDPSPVTRAIGAVVVTAFGVMVMLALKPPPDSPYSNKPSPQPSCVDLAASTPLAPSVASLTPRSTPSLEAAPSAAADEDCSPTSTHYRAFADMTRNHSGDWLPSLQTPAEHAHEVLSVNLAAPLLSTTSPYGSVGAQLGND